MKIQPTRSIGLLALLSLVWIGMIHPLASPAVGQPVFGEPLAAPSDDPGPLPEGGDVIPPHADAGASLAPAAPPIDFSTVPGPWVAQGPGPISNGQVEGIPNGYVCGAVHTVIAHPTNASIVYIGAANGGVWKTTNATAANPTWVTTTDSLGSLSIGALTFDPLDATGNTVWAGIGRFSSWYRLGGSRSGLLKTTDGGATWTTVDGGGILLGKNVSGLVVRGNTILVAVNTGDVAGNANHGVWRSTNGGTTFTQMAVGDGTGPTGLPEGIAFDIVSSPSAPNTVYTCIAIPTTAAARGIYKSTDLGATWSRVSTAAIHTYFTTVTSNIEMSVGNANNVFAGILESGAPVAIFSTADGGASWTKMDLPTMPVTSAVTRTVTNATNASPIVITTSAAHGYSTNNYVEIAGVAGNTAANGIHQITVLTTTTFSLDFSAGNGAYTSGGTARFVTSPSPAGLKGPADGTPEEIAGGQGSIHFSILADPSNAALVYMAGDRQDLPFPNYIGAVNYSGNLWRGDTGLAPNGLSPSSQWKHLTHSNAVAGIPGGGTSNNSSPHADSRDMAIDVNGSLIEVDDGGVYRRSNPQNNTGSWISMAGNLQVTEAHSVAYDTVSNIIITGNQDNGTSVQNSDGSLAYTAVSTADGGDVAVSVNPANPAQSIRYSSFQNLGAGSFRRRVMSNTNTLVSQTFPALTPQGGAPALVGQFTTPVEVNTVNANRLIIGASNGVYESTDQGSTVSRVSTLSPNDAGSGGRTMICGGRKSGADNAEVIYFADSSSIYRRVVAAGALTAVAGYAGGTVRGIVADSEDHDHLFAIDNNQVFRSTDGGVIFTDITGDIPAAAKDFRSVEFIRAGNEWAIVVGTLRGVYAARYSAVTDWALVGTNMPNVYVWDMDYDASDNLLIVSTLGRGAWRFGNARSIAQQIGPVASALGSVVTGEFAPNGAGANDGTKFDVLKRGGFLAENGHLVFPGNLLVGTGGVTTTTAMGLWKKGAGDLSLLARSGNVAPEATGATFDVLPVAPAINDSGEVTFLGSLLVGSGAPPTTAGNDTGLWSELGGTGLGILMREGDTIPPVTPLQIGAFASGAYATANTGPGTGEAVFSVTMKNGSTDTAILRASVTGPLVTAVQLVARENTPMPGVAGELFGPLASSYSDPAHMDAAGNVVFGAVTRTARESIWYQPVAPAGGPAAKVFITGEVAPGTGGATFLSLKSATIGGGGVITFRGFLNANTGDNVGNLRNDGIWRGTGSNAAGYLCILRRGDSGLPGMPALPAKVGNLWHSWLTNGNRGAWLGWLDLNGDASSSTAAGDVTAIYTDLSGAMSILIKAGDAAPGISGATMASFDLPIVGGAQQAVFLSKVTGGGTTAANNQGVWRTAPNGGALSLVLRTGDTMTTTQGVKTVQKIDFPGSNSTQRRWAQPVMDSTGRTLIFVTFTDGATTEVLAP